MKKKPQAKVIRLNQDATAVVVGHATLTGLSEAQVASLFIDRFAAMVLGSITPKQVAEYLDGLAEIQKQKKLAATRIAIATKKVRSLDPSLKR